MGLEDCEQPQQGPDDLQHLYGEQVCQPGARVSLVQEDQLVAATPSDWHSWMCVCCLQRASPASHLLLLRSLSMEDQQQQMEDCLQQRFLDPTLDFFRNFDCTSVPKLLQRVCRALVEPPELEWVETPQTGERTLLLSPFSTHLLLAFHL